MIRAPVFDRPIAHRGLHDRAAGIIENSASAFAAAISGDYAIECDLQLSRDGVPMVIHDPDLSRLAGRPDLVSALTAAELGALPLTGSTEGDTPQTFAQLLEQVAGRAMLQVELKRQANADAGRTLAAAAAATVRGYGGPLVFESFDPGLVFAVRRAGFYGPVGIITEAYGGGRDHDTYGLSPVQRFALRHLLHWPWTRFDFISCAANALGLPAIRLFRSLGKPVTAWTVRSAAAATAVADSADQIVFEGFAPRA